MFKLILLLFIATPCFADIYVVYNPTTHEVDSLSNSDDAIVANGMSKKIIKGNVEDYYSQSDAKDFTFNGSKLTLNAKKITDRQVAKQVKIDKINADKTSAITKLKAVGLTDDEINAIIK